MQQGATPFIALMIMGAALLFGGGGFVSYRAYQAHKASAALQLDAQTKQKNEETQRLAFLEAKLSELEDKKEKNKTASTTEIIQALQQEVGALKAQRLVPQKTIGVSLHPAPEVAPAPLSSSPVVSSISSNGPSKADIVGRVKPAVVYLENRWAKGSGFLVDDHFILTNAHVLKDVFAVTVKTSVKQTLTGYVVARNEDDDIALISIEENIGTPLHFGSSNETKLPQGIAVYTFGFPFGLEGDVSFNDGTISRRLKYKEREYLEISNAIHPGNSGGPLINEKGEVVGMNTMIFGSEIDGVILGETIKLAIPGDDVSRVYGELKAKRQTFTEVRKQEIRTYEKFLDDFENVWLSIDKGTALSVEGLNEPSEKQIADGVAMLDEARAESISLTTRYPKDFPFSGTVVLMLKNSSYASKQMEGALPIAHQMVVAGDTQIGYSYYTDLKQRVDNALESATQVREQYKEVLAAAGKYFSQ